MRIFILSIILALSFKANAIISPDYFDISKFLGSWSWTTSAKCTETYTFKEKGILQLKSGEELTDNKYQIKKTQFNKCNLIELISGGGRSKIFFILQFWVPQPVIPGLA